ncbi:MULTISPECIES: hypothetical protein [Arsenicicoccus]|uniref:hypothetical protein n=1 Tax=Arsenicicoccus TaxID=267408 RepID=UPI00257CBA09|nr:MULTISPECIES: hypothetical protein [Arsenicicoccus]
MALINCRECTKQVADSAPTCPHCGIRSPGGAAKLEVRRVKRLDGAIVPLVVMVDNEEMARLTSNKSFNMTVSPGTHRIECVFLKRPVASAAQEFDVPAGKTLVITVAMSRLTGKPQFSAEVA